MASNVVDNAEYPKLERDVRFWLVIIAICSSLFLGALELTAVSTALPTIVDSVPDFPSDEFVWIGSAYALASSAFLPLSGSFAEIFGRRPIMLFSVAAFLVGSAMCGSAHSQELFLAGRTVQGLGGGGILSLTNIILADLVPLRERGLFNGMIGVTWSVAAAIGPVVGGALAEAGVWRWLFYMNLPIGGVVLLLVIGFLRLPTPRTSFSEKMAQFDWIGMLLVIGSSSAILLALTWGGVVFEWSSPRVLASLICGSIGLIAFVVYERYLASNPIVPWVLLSNRTSLSGYYQTFTVQAILVSFIYYMPVYFQACKNASPTGSGVDLFGLALTLSPISIIGGVSITVLRRYRPQIWLGWAVSVLAMGLLCLLHSDTPRATSIGLGVLTGAGVGTAYTGTFFPVLAPLPVNMNARAIALGVFLRSFAQVWGITIGGAILQNELVSKLPAQLRDTATSRQNVAYGLVVGVKALEEPLKSSARVAFAESLRHVWFFLLGLSTTGLLASFFMRGLPLHTELDKKWVQSSSESASKEVTEGNIEIERSLGGIVGEK